MRDYGSLPKGNGLFRAVKLAGRSLSLQTSRMTWSLQQLESDGAADVGGQRYGEGVKCQERNIPPGPAQGPFGEQMP